MDTPLEESNLAHIGSAEDIAAKKAAAETEVNWSGAGQKEGIQIWRVENRRDDNGNPKFGINPWPEKLYGEFYTGDSYIVLQSTREKESGSFLYDIYFWIGSESSQDEYGVAAYKANELDDLLDDAPIQHREVQFHESDGFLKCFPQKIKYLDGGIDSGFRNVDPDAGAVELPTMLFHVRRDNRITRCVQVPAKCSSLNQGDAFVLRTSKKAYTWFGSDCSPFEKSKAAQVAHDMVIASNGHSTLVEEVGDDDEEFWENLGGKGHIKEADDFHPEEALKPMEPKMCILAEVDSFITIEKCEALKSNLRSDDVCLIDNNTTIFVWIGKGSSKREQTQAMVTVQKYITTMKREGNTQIVRVKEGQERRVPAFNSALK